ncbi:MAG: tetratricopeptide (TPR) repeat protein, partial [Bradymonadia bacterium]
ASHPRLDALTTRSPPPPSWRSRSVTQPSVGLGLRLFGARARPLVGRDAAADVLWRRVLGAHARESARVVVVEGAQGTGKSHLAGWIGARADELGAARLLTARYADATPDTRGLVGLLRSILRSGSDLDRVRRLRGADQTGASDAAVHTLAFGGSRLTDRDSARVARVVISWLCQWAAPRMPYLWLDDAQWDDEPWWLAEAALELDLPIVVVLTVRDDAIAEHRLRRLTALQGDRRVRRLPLAPLESADHRALIDGLLPLAPDVAAALTERTHGRPLFAVHVVADWVARGLLESTPSGLRPRADVEVAASLDALWLARIAASVGETIAPDLGLAALLGERVDDVLLGEAAALAGVAVDTDRFHALCRAGLARRLRQGWAFAHGLIRDAIGRRFGTPELHTVCAGALTARVVLPSDWRAVAEHWIKAGDADRAATAALCEYDGNIGSSLRHDFLTGLARIEALLDSIGASPQDPRRLRIELRRVAARFPIDPVTDLLDRITAVESAAHTHDHLAEWGEALRMRAIVVRNSVGRAPAEPIFRQAFELLTRAGDRRSAACAALGRAPCLRAMGRRTQAIEVAREALATFTALNDTWWTQTARMELAEMLNEIDAFDAAQTILEEALSLAHATGDLVNQGRGLRRLAERPLAHGQYGLAESYLLQAARCFAADQNINASYIPAWRARVALHRGALTAASALYAEYRRFADSVTYLDQMPWLAVIPAIDAAVRGDDAGWSEGWDAITRQNTESWPAEARRDLAAAVTLLPEKHQAVVRALVAALALS